MTMKNTNYCPIKLSFQLYRHATVCGVMKHFRMFRRLYKNCRQVGIFCGLHSCHLFQTIIELCTITEIHLLLQLVTLECLIRDHDIMINTAMDIGYQWNVLQEQRLTQIHAYVLHLCKGIKTIVKLSILDINTIFPFRVIIQYI